MHDDVDQALLRESDERQVATNSYLVDLDKYTR
jgi:hypothetical protein